MFVTPGYAQEAHPHEGEAHEGQEAGHETDASFPPFDSSTYASQLLWLAITFGLFYWFLKNVILPRLGGILEVRENRIAQDLAQAGKLKEEADASVAAYEQELAGARAKANAIGQQARDAGKAEADAERRRVEGELSRKLAEAEARIAAIKSAAMSEVGGIAEETAAAIVERLTGSATEPAAVAAAVDSVRGR